MKALVAEMDRNLEVSVIRPEGRLDAFQAPVLSEALAEKERAHV